MRSSALTGFTSCTISPPRGTGDSARRIRRASASRNASPDRGASVDRGAVPLS